MALGQRGKAIALTFFYPEEWGARLLAIGIGFGARALAFGDAVAPRIETGAGAAVLKTGVQSPVAALFAFLSFHIAIAANPAHQRRANHPAKTICTNEWVGLGKRSKAGRERDSGKQHFHPFHLPPARQDNNAGAGVRGRVVTKGACVPGT